MDAFDATRTSYLESLRHNWGWLMALGIALVILGILALIFTVATTVISVILLGVVVLVAGVVIIASAFSAEGAGGMILRLLLGILVVGAGIYLMVNPKIGAITLTLVLAWYFIIAGVLRIAGALVEHDTGWGWKIFTGSVTLLLGILLSASWPVSGVYAIGLFVGIDLILNGSSWIAAALMARSYTPPHAAPAL
jgi:uncharacterized membrane protein HdeD (DUF308 family)